MAQYSAEASTLGWAPGHWPAKFTDTSRKPHRVWVRQGTFTAPRSDGGRELLYVRYLEVNKEDELTVFND